MLSAMKVTIDIPDDLLARVKPLLEARNLTFQALEIDAIERALTVPAVSFQLRDASTGSELDDGGVSGETINRAIDESRAVGFRT